MKLPVCVGLSILLLLAISLPSHSEEDALRLLVLGDSLTAGYGIPIADAFPTQLQSRLDAAGYRVTVINAGVSGDTTAGGVSRLEWALADEPDLVIVELGGNDALRGLAPEQTRDNLDRIIARFTDSKVDVLLAGMRAPRNLGPAYYSKFDSLYPDLATKHNIPIYPFFLDGVAGNPQLNLADGIHPNAMGVKVIIERILPYVEKLITERLTDNDSK